MKPGIAVAALLVTGCAATSSTTAPPAVNTTPPSHYQRVVACVQQVGAPGMGNNPAAAVNTLGCAKASVLTAGEKTCARQVAAKKYPLGTYEQQLAACWGK